MTAAETLYQFMQTRPRPEDVAQYIVGCGVKFTERERRILKMAARHSFRNTLYDYSSMASDFFRPDTAEKQVKTASELFGVCALSSAECADPALVEGYVRHVSKLIGKQFGCSDFKDHRLNREQRIAAGLRKGHRWYNKRFRLLGRMERKILRMVREGKKYLLTRVGKSGFAIEVPYEEFAADLPTACFVTYMAACMSRRSVFTNTSQSRAYDEVASVLYNKLTHRKDTRWGVIAAVYPVKRVLSKLDDGQKGAMLARCWKLFEVAGELLAETWETSAVERSTMIVQRDCDSSTWNQVAGGWNKTREHWISLTHALGMQSILDELCPGKVMRLMAADVAYWHRRSGGDVHPATKVWADLPLPWEVVEGKVGCTRVMVEEACKRHGVNPASWVGAKVRGKVEEFTPTPELVHGVAVSSPALAKALRKAGVFSGKMLKHVPDKPFHVERDKDGFALRALDGVLVDDLDDKTKREVLVNGFSAGV